MKKRSGEKVGWIAGWGGGFIWVLILAGLFFYRHEFGQGVVGVVLTAVAVASVLYCAPWRHPSTPYWKLMLLPYCLFFIAIAWATWSFGGLEALGFNWLNLLWLVPALSPFGFLSNNRWEQFGAQPDAPRDGDSTSLHPRR